MLVNFYIRQHSFLQTSLKSFTTSERRRYERDIYDYARGVGLLRAEAKKEVMKARGFCGEINYNSDHSALEDEIDDSATIKNTLLAPDRSSLVSTSLPKTAERARPGLLKRRHTAGIDLAQSTSKRRKQAGDLVGSRNKNSEHEASDVSKPVKINGVPERQLGMVNKRADTSVDKRRSEEMSRTKKRQHERLAKTAEPSTGTSYSGDCLNNVENVITLQGESAVLPVNEVNHGSKRSLYTRKDMRDALSPTEPEDLQHTHKANHTGPIFDPSVNVNTKTERVKQVKDDFESDVISSNQDSHPVTRDTVDKGERSRSETGNENKSIPDGIGQARESRHFTKNDVGKITAKMSRKKIEKQADGSGIKNKRYKQNGKNLAKGQASVPGEEATEQLPNQRQSETKTRKTLRSNAESISATKTKRTRLKKDGPTDASEAEDKQHIQKSNLEPLPVAISVDQQDENLKAAPSTNKNKGRKKHGKEDSVPTQHETNNQDFSTTVEHLSIPNPITENGKSKEKDKCENKNKTGGVAPCHIPTLTDAHVPTLTDTETTKNPDFHSPMIQQA